MKSFIKGVGNARQKPNSIFKWHIPAIVSITFVLISCNSTYGQSPRLNKEQLNADTVLDLKIQSIKDFRVASLYGSHNILLKNPLRDGSKKSVVGERPSFRQYKIKNGQPLMDMNRKLDSAWRKFDQRCRARGKLLN